MNPKILNHRLMQLESTGCHILSEVDNLMSQVDSFNNELETLNEEVAQLDDHIGSSSP